MKKPIIGIVMNYDEKGEYFSEYPWYALRKDYFRSVQNAGGAPVGLPFHVDAIPDYVRMMDGLLIAGGEDYPPEFYGEAPMGDKLNLLKGGRSEFDFKILATALEKNIPVLGICAGEQAINIYFGGTLIQDIETMIPGALNHMKPCPSHEPSHLIEIEEGTLLHHCTGAKAYKVNSAHHQAVNRVGKGLIVNARSPDGVIEGIEHPDYKFCLGVEWHPEFEIDAEDRRLMKAFVSAAQS
jgi:putative glutamine amidotransferase